MHTPSTGKPELSDNLFYITSKKYRYGLNCNPDQNIFSYVLRLLVQI